MYFRPYLYGHTRHLFTNHMALKTLLKLYREKDASLTTDLFQRDGEELNCQLLQKKSSFPRVTVNCVTPGDNYLSSSISKI